MSSEVEVIMQEKFQNGDMEVSEEMNGNIQDGLLEGNDSSSKHVRIIHKAKRFHRSNSGSDTPLSNGTDGGVLPLSLSKNSRKSRDGRGRGMPKKGGAGGKGTWGAPGDELFEDGHCRDAKDPNYDSESEDEYIVEEIKPEATLEEVQKLLQPVLLEYYEHGDTSEVQTTINEMNLGKQKPRIVELAVNLALDHKATHREMTSVLISDLYSKTLSASEISCGFDAVLKTLSDLTIDTPDAPLVVGQFVARAVADDCLAPKFIASYKGKVECSHMQEALDKAELLLSRKHGIVRLDNIWGTGGGIRPVKYLIKQIVLLLKEYLSSGEIVEATRCLQELEVPHFYHEFVYEATVMVLEDSSERAAHRMCDLLKSLGETMVITPEQMTQGFQRIYDSLPDISLDVPAAYSLLERFAAMCHREGILSTDLFKELPQRGRKRFVSEGDGGKIKELQL